MTRELLKIVGGRVYDPAHGIDGEVRDLWIEQGRIISPPEREADVAVRTLDATGLVVMPGGVDMHCHIAGPKVNAGRKLLPEQRRNRRVIERDAHHARSGTLGSVPSTFATGYLYAGLGYTTAMDAAIAPLMARHAHQQFADTPCIDRGMFLLTGNNHYLLEAIGAGEPQRVREYLGWLLTSAKAFAPKVVNPGGVENWKSRGGTATDLDAAIDGFDVTPRKILVGLAQAAAELELPHPLHVHTQNLGLPGNWRTTLATMEAFEGRRAHLAHIQFHSYAGGEADEATFGSQVTPLADYVNSHDNLTIDVGQVLFGVTASMTGDGPLGYYLAKLYRSKWYSADIELEAGCGVSPIEYKNTSLIHAWQWAIGLEWFLQVNDPWRVAMSTDHPNGAAFLAYPRIIRLLMDRDFRREEIAQLPKKVRETTNLRHLDREYSLGEICVVTRAGPARMLGLTAKGHLGVGADADITIYTSSRNYEAMFELPRHVLKAGKLVIENGEVRAEPYGRTLHVDRPTEAATETHLAAWHTRHSTIRPRNLVVAADYLGEGNIVAVDRRE